MTKFEVIKSAGQIIVTLGVGAIVKNVVKTTTPTNTKGFSRICIIVGAFVLTDMVSDKVSDYAGERFDAAIEWLGGKVKEATNV